VDVHLPKGTRDFLPDVMRNRQRVMDRVRAVFGRYGFQPLETPAFERIETLTGKYGNEGEKLMFRILARGEGGERGEVDLALRYDLTVPLARVIAVLLEPSSTDSLATWGFFNRPLVRQWSSEPGDYPVLRLAARPAGPTTIMPAE